MKYALQLRFRAAAAEIAGSLPSELNLVAATLKPGDSPAACRADVVLAADVSAALVAWGRQVRNNSTLLAGVNVVPVYEAEDLGASELVELCLPYNMDKCRVRNNTEALNVVWACAYCDRTRATQAADLQVDLPNDYAMHQTYNNEWTVPATFIPFLDHYGLKTRPLQGNPDHVQVLLDQTVSLDVSTPPLASYGQPCPGCGGKSIRRQRGLEGIPLDQSFTGLTMYTDSPVTIKAADVSRITFARSIERLHNPRVGTSMLHRPGDQIDYRHIALHYYDARPIFVTKAELVHQLFEAQAEGFAYRPVIMA